MTSNACSDDHDAEPRPAPDDVDFPWVTIPEAAALLQQRGVLVFHFTSRTWRAPSIRLVRKWCARGLLPTRRVGNRYLIYRPALDAFTPPRPGRPYQPDVTPEARRRRGKRRRTPPPPHDERSDVP